MMKTTSAEEVSHPAPQPANAGSPAAPGTPAKSGPVELLRQPYPGDPTKEIVLIRATFAPGDSTPPHHHPGLLAGYVLSGEYEFQLEGQPLRRIAPGAAFFEPPGSAHVVSRNPGASATQVLAFIIREKDAKVMIPLDRPSDPAKG